jgi:hypothetical protein
MQEYRTRLNKFGKREKALAEIVEHIHKTLALTLRPYIRGVDFRCNILQALKKRLAPTDRARCLQLAQAYNALKKAPRAQGTGHWLQQWETTYAEAEKLNLAEVQDHKALYDFIQASKAIDPAYPKACQVYVDTKLEDDANNVPTLYNAVERFRNNTHTDRAVSKAKSHAAFATLQGQAQSEVPADNQSTQPTEPKQHTGCLCGAQHSWSNCPYLIKQRRPPGWVADEQTQKGTNQSCRLTQGFERLSRDNARQQISKISSLKVSKKYPQSYKASRSRALRPVNFKGLYNSYKPCYRAKQLPLA